MKSRLFAVKKLNFSRVEDPLADVAGGSLVELERKIRDRNDRIRSTLIMGAVGFVLPIT